MLIVVADRGAVPLLTTRWDHTALLVNGDEGVVSAYDYGYWESASAAILGYIHSDVTIHDADWYERIEAEFIDPKVAIVGMGGALGIGTADIYKTRYNIWQLQRIDYRSNQTDWQVHGAHETGACDVAVVDGFFMAIRRSFLDQIGGWSWMKTTFHCYDTCMCLMAQRLGWKVRMVGVNCTHHGGGTSTSAGYKEWLESQGTTQAADHAEPHVWMYNEFRDVLPLRVK